MVLKTLHVDADFFNYTVLYRGKNLSFQKYQDMTGQRINSMKGLASLLLSVSLFLECPGGIDMVLFSLFVDIFIHKLTDEIVFEIKINCVCSLIS